MSKKNPLYPSGVTTEGVIVIGGLFEMADTYGFPLTESLFQLRERGFCPDWHDYIGSAVHADWDDEQIERKINTAMSEAESPAEWQNGVRSLIPKSISYHRRHKALLEMQSKNPE